MPTSSATSTADPTASPTEAPTPSETVSSNTVAPASGQDSVDGTITLTVVQGDSIDLGTVPLDRGKPDGLGIGSFFYTAAGAGVVQITVTSHAPAWSGSCRVTADNGGAGASSMTVAGGALAWRINDPTTTADDDPTTATGWTDFLTDAADGSCIPSPPDTLIGPPYSYTYTYDFRLHVIQSDTPGSFRAVITYEVTS
jgi:hypothetical protein